MIKPMLLIFFTKIWPQYELDNDCKWPDFSTLDFKILYNLNTLHREMANNQRSITSKPFPPRLPFLIPRLPQAEEKPGASSQTFNFPFFLSSSSLRMLPPQEHDPLCTLSSRARSSFSPPLNRSLNYPFHTFQPLLFPSLSPTLGTHRLCTS